MTQGPDPRPAHRFSRSLPAAMLAGLGIAATTVGFASALFAGDRSEDAIARAPTIPAGFTAAATPEATATPCNDSTNQVEGYVRDGVTGTLHACTGGFVPYTPTPAPT